MWNWINRFNIGRGFRGSMNRNGVGFSWGIPGLRIGISPSGYKWIYIGIPGTGLGFYKRFNKKQKKKKQNKTLKWKEL